MTDEEMEVLREMTKQNEMNEGCGTAAGFMAVVVLLVVLLLSGCRTMEVATQSQHTVHDTTYVVKVQRDSVWVETLKHDSVVIREKGDTVWVERWKIEYRDRWHDYLQVDTVHDAYVERDTVVVTKTVTKTSGKTKASWWLVGMIGGAAVVVILRRCRSKG